MTHVNVEDACSSCFVVQLGRICLSHVIFLSANYKMEWNGSFVVRFTYSQDLAMYIVVQKISVRKTILTDLNFVRAKII